ncbi:MAG: D-isomer specific 2-hydroxyacid dehydrogenase family protein [Actinomycetota bacterium]
MSDTRIAIEPASEPGLEKAVTEGGGTIVGHTEADGLIWINPRDPQGLKERLAASPATWVQLPFAGIESFVAAGVIDPERVWTCAKGIYGPACAEHALALMLAAARRIAHHARARRWEVPGLGSPERRLKGTTVLVVGTGGIGSALIEMLQPFEVSIIAMNRSGRHVAGVERTEPVAALDRAAADADFVVIAAALTDETRGLVNGGTFAAMKSDAWLVNVARGGLVDTEALLEALGSDAIAGAALDVTDPEPLPEDHPLWSLDNALITPHIANTWDMAVPELRALVRRNVEKFRRGEELEGLVDISLGY